MFDFLERNTIGEGTRARVTFDFSQTHETGGHHSVIDNMHSHMRWNRDNVENTANCEIKHLDYSGGDNTKPDILFRHWGGQQTETVFAFVKAAAAKMSEGYQYTYRFSVEEMSPGYGYKVSVRFLTSYEQLLMRQADTLERLESRKTVLKPTL